MGANHTPQRRRSRTALGLLTLLALLSACGGGQVPTDSTAAAAASERESGLSRQARTVASTGSTTTATSTTAIAQPANTEGRLLASNCFQCHGTLGLGGFEKIRGSEASEVLEYLTKTASKDIMAAHAQGYTTAQLKTIIAYLQQ